MTATLTPMDRVRRNMTARENWRLAARQASRIEEELVQVKADLVGQQYQHEVDIDNGEHSETIEAEIDHLTKRRDTLTEELQAAEDKTRELFESMRAQRWKSGQ